MNAAEKAMPSEAHEPIKDANDHIVDTTREDHKGTDFTTQKEAKPVYSVKDGEIGSNTSEGSRSHANILTIYNDDGSVSRYIHVGSDLKSGERVEGGEEIGETLLPGQSGYGSTNTGPHLHYEQYASQADFDKRNNMPTKNVISQWMKVLGRPR